MDFSKEEILKIKAGELKYSDVKDKVSNAFFNKIKRGQVKKYEALIAEGEVNEDSEEPKNDEEPENEEGPKPLAKNLEQGAKEAKLFELIKNTKLRELAFTDGRIFIYVPNTLLKEAGFNFTENELRVECSSREDFKLSLSKELAKLK